MNIVIPMAGRGSRFANIGIKTPKPLIDVKGIPMYQRSVNSLPLKHASRIIFLCLEEHLKESELERDIMAAYSAYNPVVVSVNEVTEGQACTVLLAGDLIDNDEGLMIYNADTAFQSDLGDLVTQKNIDGVVSVFKDTNPKWSFARIDEQGFIVEIAEKKVISDLATVGMYYFSRGNDFVRAARHMIAKDLRVNNEFYVGPVYNVLVEEGKKIIVDYVSRLDCMGTPEDLATYLRDTR